MVGVQQIRHSLGHTAVAGQDQPCLDFMQSLFSGLTVGYRQVFLPVESDDFL
jgi:hypothetical protein